MGERLATGSTYMLPFEALLDGVERNPTREHLAVRAEKLVVHLEVCHQSTIVDVSAHRCTVNTSLEIAT